MLQNHNDWYKIFYWKSILHPAPVSFERRHSLEGCRDVFEEELSEPANLTRWDIQIEKKRVHGPTSQVKSWCFTAALEGGHQRKQFQVLLMFLSWKTRGKRGPCWKTQHCWSPAQGMYCKLGPAWDAGGPDLNSVDQHECDGLYWLLSRGWGDGKKLIEENQGMCEL